MEIALAFWPSLAIGFCLLILFQVKRAAFDYPEQMYQLGVKHGRQEIWIEIYEQSLEGLGRDFDPTADDED